MVEIRRVGVVSLALMTGLLYLIMGLIIALPFACAMIVGGVSLVASLEELPGLGESSILFGLLYAVCLPILLGAIGFIAGAILAIAYNILAGIIGGIKIELKGTELVKAPQQ